MSDTCGRCGHRYDAEPTVYDLRLKLSKAEAQLAGCVGVISNFRKILDLCPTKADAHLDGHNQWAHELAKMVNGPEGAYRAINMFLASLPQSAKAKADVLKAAREFADINQRFVDGNAQIREVDEAERALCQAIRAEGEGK